MTQTSQLTVVLGAVRDPEGRVLVACRRDASVPDAQGKWEFVGGNIEFGETPEAAVVREVVEESGLQVRVIRLLPKVFSTVWNTAAQEQVQVFLLTYECEVVSGGLTNTRVSDEISELKFVSLSELETYDTLPNVKESIPFL